MREPQSFMADCVELAAEQHAKGRIDRRTLVKLLGALGLAPIANAVMPGMSAAQAREVVMVNWGGIANTAFSRFYGAPFEAKNPGVKVTQDSSGPSAAKIRAMVEARRVTWDLCDSSSSSSIQLSKLNLLEPIDYAIVDKSLLPAQGFAYPYGAAAYSFSSLIVYDAEKFRGDPPKGWADFWNLQKYPGKRMLRNDPITCMDAAVMSTGVPLDKVYPINEKLAFDQLKKIKNQLVFWTNGTESEQIMRTGEASMGLIWHTRAKVLFEETKGKIDFTWAQGILQPGIFVVPKGNPAGKLAMQLLRSMQEPDPQIGLLQFLGNGPTNPKAAAAVPAEFRRFNPMDPDNAKVQLVISGEYWGENQFRLIQEYKDVISS